MRRNQRAAATVEPSWWRHDSDDSEPPDDHDDRDLAPCGPEPDAQPLPLLTHPVPLRIVEPDEPSSPAAEPVAPQTPDPEPTPGPATIVADPAAVQLATCYAIDYLSWDATNPSTQAIGDSVSLKKGCAAFASCWGKAAASCSSSRDETGSRAP